jgi:hypothetical protein
MRLNLATIQELLNSVKGKSPDAIFSILSTELELPIKYTSSMTEDERKKCYHLMALKLHPDRVEDGAQEKAKELFQLLGGAYTALRSGNSTILDTSDINGPIDKLWEFIVNREFMDNPWDCTDESSLDFLDVLLPTRPSTLADVTEQNWQDASQKLDELLSKLEQIQAIYASQTILVNIEHIKTFRRTAIERFKANVRYRNEPNEHGFIINVVLPSIAKAAKTARNTIMGFPFRSEKSYNYDVPTDIILCQTLGLGLYKNNALTDPFLANKTLAQRKELYLSIKRSIQPYIDKDKALYQYCMEIVCTIREYQEHYSGFLGTIRRYYRQLFDTEAWVAEQQQLETIEQTTLKPLINILGSGKIFSEHAFSTEEHNAFEINPTITEQASPFLFTLIQRITEFYIPYRLTSAAHYEEIYLAYNDVRENEPTASNRPNISREMGAFGLFGTFGATKPRQRYLHTLKAKLVDKLVAEAEQTPEQTITVPQETLAIIKQHNGRFWRIGPTASETRFEQLFVKQEGNEYRLQPNPLTR